MGDDSSNRRNRMGFCLCVPAPPVGPSAGAIDDDAQDGGDHTLAEEEKDLSASTLQLPDAGLRGAATSPQQPEPEPEPRPGLPGSRASDDMETRLTEAEIRIESRLQSIADRVAKENELDEVDAVLASSRRAIELLAALQAEEAPGPAAAPRHPVSLQPTKSTEEQLFACAEALSAPNSPLGTRKLEREPVLEPALRQLPVSALTYPQTKGLTPDSRARYNGELQRGRADQEVYACQHWAYCKFSGRYEDVLAHEQWCGF